MADRHSIPAFPFDIDRDEFAHWLTGFTDGEGCFQLRLADTRGRRNPYACFGINLRADDVEILRQIQSFWQCGNLCYNSNRSREATARPAWHYSVNAAA